MGGLRRRATWVAGFLAAASLTLLPARSTAAPTGTFGHAGRWITDAQGRVYVPHGTNYVDKGAPYLPDPGPFTDAELDQLVADGFTVMRYGVEHDGLEPRPYQYDDAYIDRIVADVRQMVAHGIHPLIDYHQDQYGPALNGNGIAAWATIDDGLPHQPDCGFGCTQLAQPAVWRAFDHFWADDHLPGDPIGIQDHVVRAFARLAARLAPVDGLLGYEFLNEPWAGSQYPTCAQPLGCPQFEATAMAQFDQRMVTAVRAVDRRHLVFHEPQTIFNDGVLSWLPRMKDPVANDGFAFHIYCVLGSADATAERPGGTQVCPTLESRVYANAVTRVKTSHEALLLTEFGATPVERPVRHIVEEADAQMVPWLYWEYREYFQEDQALLVRPHPESVAGTPTSWSYDDRSGVFRFSYATARAGGGTFPPGTRTTIATPAKRYPAGYRVTVSGASVVSAPGAPVLELVSDPGARTVTVTVTP